MSALKRVQNFSIVLVLLWCFVCFYIQECLGWVCPSNIAVWILDFFVLPFLSYPVTTVMSGGDDGQGGVVVFVILFIMHLIDYDGAHI